MQPPLDCVVWCVVCGVVFWVKGEGPEGCVFCWFGQTNTYTRSLLEPKPLPPRNECRCWSAPTVFCYG
jgi:hypothetical protein